jgi:hypothetical protein
MSPRTSPRPKTGRPGKTPATAIGVGGKLKRMITTPIGIVGVAVAVLLLAGLDGRGTGAFAYWDKEAGRWIDVKTGEAVGYEQQNLRVSVREMLANVRAVR